MKGFITNLCLFFGISITKLTAENELKTLIQKLRPVTADFDLVRLGPDGDGGYLVPDDFEGIEACFSPGVGPSSGFEKSCSELGMKVFLADKSVDKPAAVDKNFSFEKKYIGGIISNDFLTLDHWVKQSRVGSESDLLLQMDIEGYEYEALYNASSGLMNRFRIMVIEFHNLHLLFSKPYFGQVSNVFEKILQSHHCVHIHPNNCCYSAKKGEIQIPTAMEFTFIRKDRITHKNYASIFPHPLDFDTTKEKSLVLPACWYTDAK